MTLRETIATEIWSVQIGDKDRDQAADAILAAVREHMTSPEAVERATVAWNNNGYGSHVSAAILAALGGINETE